MNVPHLRERLFPAMMLCALLGLQGGCATAPSPAGTTGSLTDLEMVGRFGELEKAAERKLSAQTPPGTAVLGPLCLAYARVKRYDKLFDCLDRLEKQIQAGDSVLTTDKAMISNSDGTPMPNMLRAEALVEYYYQGSRMVAFVLNREGLRMLRLDATGIDEEITRLRSELQHADSQAWQDSARTLYLRLWKPLEGVLTEKSVILVAHGSLHYLPFASLLKPDGSFLIEHSSIRFLPSASVLQFLRPALGTKGPKLLVFGNPDLGDAALDLQFAESEARAVSSLYPDSRMMIRREASETNFKRAAPSFQRLHFATHGKFQAESPLESRLYLSKDVENDGMLTAGEIYTMNMDTDLVTLSACETGLGKVAGGDDVVGLTRGFLFAGSRSIVASLWSVDDKSTAELMKIFYENLTRMSKDRALAEAQMKIRQAFPHPFFWAAFQLTGRAD